MRMFQSAMSHTADDRMPCFEVIFYIDEDDQPSIDLWENNLHRDVDAVVGPRINLSHGLESLPLMLVMARFFFMEEMT